MWGGSAIGAIPLYPHLLAEVPDDEHVDACSTNALHKLVDLHACLES